MLAHARAILWAQWRTLVNFYSRGRAGLAIFTAIASVLWYLLAAVGAALVGLVASEPARLPLFKDAAPQGLFFLFLYWQVVPLALATTGAALDLKRLRAYPVGVRQLFGLEVLLRLSTGVEPVMFMVAGWIGLLFNSQVPKWAPMALLPYLAFNLLLAIGLRDLLARLMVRRGVREALVLGLVLLSALPQIFLITGTPERWRAWIPRLDFAYWPWRVAAEMALGNWSLDRVLVFSAWVAGAGLFGWRQFQRRLRFDPDERRASGGREASALAGWQDRVLSIPSRLLPDPLGAMVEKELRFLSRAPRFRLLFLMGFTFGLLIWLPLAFRSGAGANGLLASNYLSFVSMYALMLLGETFWNAFGFDRSASQNYFVLPVPLSKVLAAKNIAAAVVVFLEVAAIATVCALLGLPTGPAKVAEAFAVSTVFVLMLLGIGNLGSVYYPRPLNPAESWRASSGSKIQVLLVAVYPVIMIPISLAYLARWATESQWAFYGVLAVNLMLAMIFYWVATDSATIAAERRKEDIARALSEGEGPVGA